MRDTVLKLVREALPEDLRDEAQVMVPERDGHGHYSTNAAFVLAKKEGRKPMEVARGIKGQISKIKNVGDLFGEIEVAEPGFVNFFISERCLGEMLEEINREGDRFGKGGEKKETIVIEYSSPNIAKPLGVHHLRSTIIGQALVNILRFVGYRVVSLSFPGDWGTQFGLLIAGYKRWGDKKRVKEAPIDEMLSLYVRFSKAVEEDPQLRDVGRAEFKKLEGGDRENKRLWKWFLDESLRDFDRVYKLLGVEIEHTIGESYYERELAGIVKDALDRGVAKKGEDDSVVVDIPSSSTPEIIQKSDGATIYTTRELAAIRHRLKKWKGNKILYVAANQQTFHLDQVFKCAELLGYAGRDQLGHVKFGMMLGPGGKKFATREGRLIPLENVLKEAIDRSRKIVQELNPDLSDGRKDEVARVVGIGAVKFFDLAQNRRQDIVFEWDKMLNLKGASAPYVQYTYARLMSILRRVGRPRGSFDVSLLRGGSEAVLIGRLIHFPEVVERAAVRYEPNHLADYLLRLASAVNTFYESSPILKAEKDLRQGRLALVLASSVILKSGLGLLGIEAPEEM